MVLTALPGRTSLLEFLCPGSEPAALQSTACGLLSTGSCSCGVFSGPAPLQLRLRTFDVLQLAAWRASGLGPPRTSAPGGECSCRHALSVTSFAEYPSRSHIYPYIEYPKHQYRLYIMPIQSRALKFKIVENPSHSHRVS